MPSLIPTRWSTFERSSSVADVPMPIDDDLALGWESACPALQLEGWEPVASTPSALDSSLN